MINRVVVLFCFIIFSSLSTIAQEVKQIVSFTYKIIYDDDLKLVFDSRPMYVISPCFEYEDGSTSCKTDSIYMDDSKIAVIFPFSYKISDGWFISKRCYNYKGLSKCTKDSIMMYTPIKYFSNQLKPNFKDTASILNYSVFLTELKEPKIFNETLHNEILRFVWMKDSLSTVYRIENTHGIISLNCKTVNYINDKYKIVTDNSLMISLNTYKRILKKLKKGKYWLTNNEFIFWPRNVLIESYIQGEYFFINKNSEELTLKNRRLMYCFDMLKRLCNE